MLAGALGVDLAMLPRDAKLLALLPAIGVCACAVPRAPAPTTAPTGPASSGMIDMGRPPLTSAEEMVRIGRAALAAGDYEAALYSLSFALDFNPDRVGLRFDQLDAAIGLGDLYRAQAYADSITRHLQAEPSQASIWAPRLERRRLDMLELRNGRGVGSCEAAIDDQPRALQRVDDPFAAWNLLRSGLPATHAIPIPSNAAEAHDALCPAGCEVGVPGMARLEGDNEATIALVINHGGGSFSVMPDLLHPLASGCSDETAFGFSRHDGLVRVRAFGDRLEQVDRAVWNLVDRPDYGPPADVSVVTGPNPSIDTRAYAYGYGYGYGYGYTSSGYQYGYASSGHHGCGYGYDDDYDYEDDDGYGYGYGEDSNQRSCEIHAHVERDVIIDLARGEIMLDIVRTGERGTALGRVTMATQAAGLPVIEVQACGVSGRIELAHT